VAFAHAVLSNPIWRARSKSKYAKLENHNRIGSPTTHELDVLSVLRSSTIGLIRFSALPRAQ
jgi:hypothetical protein